MLAWDLLQKIERSSAFADVVLDQAFSKNPGLRPLDRAFISEIVLGTLRWRGRLDAVLFPALKSREKKIDPRLLQLLRLGAYQILFMDRVPESAAVNESVRLAKWVFKTDKISGFVNALLRSVVRTKDGERFPSFEEKPIEYISQALSHPRWLAVSWAKDFGWEITRKVCEANNQKPPFTIRVNTLKTNREVLRRQLNSSGFPSTPTPFSPEGLILERNPILPGDRLFKEGRYFVQDESSQIISHLLQPLPGERILDACAAPGGKTTHIAQIMNDRGEIMALDLHAAKVKLIQENCHRMGIRSVRAFQGDASQPLPFPPGMTFDRVLVDAPCSGLGILHRNPEAKWHRKPEDIARLQKLQKSILDNITSRLKPGGVLIYSTCTMTHEENEGVIEAFMETHTDFRLEDLHEVLSVSFHPLLDPQGFFRTYPERVIAAANRMDGFFAARLRKN